MGHNKSELHIQTPGINNNAASDPELKEAQNKSSNCMNTAKQMLKSNLMVILLFIGMLCGLSIGLFLRTYDPEFREDARKMMYLEFCGQLFLRMVKMIIIPLIVTSLICGMAALPTQSKGKLGGLAVTYFVSTTFLSVLLGITLVLTIQPGNRGTKGAKFEARETLVEPQDAILDFVRNCFPDNLIKATFISAKTSYVMKNITETTTVNITKETIDDSNCTINSLTTTANVGCPRINVTEEINETKTISVKTGDFVVGETEGINIIGFVLFSLVFGHILGSMGQAGAPLKSLIESLLEALIRLVKYIMWFSPIGICFLLAARIVIMDDPAERFKELGFYVVTLLSAELIHAFIVLPVIYFLFTKKNPFRLMYNMMQSLVFAWGTASSTSALPLTIMCATEKHGIDESVARFVLPVGNTINMDGTTLYEAVAAIFIAQYLNYELGPAKIVIIGLTSTAAAMGAGVPQAALVTMAIVLTAAGLPVEAAGLIYALDWFVDRFCSAVNVWSDSVGAGIIAHLTGDNLEKPALEENQIHSINTQDKVPLSIPNGTVVLHSSVNTAYDPFTDTHNMEIAIL